MPRQFTPEGESIRVGEVVAVELKRIQISGSHSWRVMPKLRVLPSKQTPNMPLQIQVQPRSGSEFELIDPATGELLRFDPTEWDPNLCRAYWKESLPTHALASRRNERWAPIDKSALEMLLETGKRGGRFFIATFLGVEISTSGNRFYRLSLEFGDNFLIPVDLFPPSDVSAIEEKLRSYLDPAGLLICISCSSSENRTQLKLWRENSVNETTSQR
jgi:hypothetical protein